ncbi:hypothetical protein BU17DRAFT_69787 [Hysterangium stoloniferum]|nr:hypothetical protein BU17DRAFT_69787 [Hysterangium stoloniferum]
MPRQISIEALPRVISLLLRLVGAHMTPLPRVSQVVWEEALFISADIVNEAYERLESDGEGVGDRRRGVMRFSISGLELDGEESTPMISSSEDRSVGAVLNETEICTAYARTQQVSCLSPHRQTLLSPHAPPPPLHATRPPALNTHDAPAARYHPLRRLSHLRRADTRDPGEMHVLSFLTPTSPGWLDIVTEVFKSVVTRDRPATVREAISTMETIHASLRGVPAYGEEVFMGIPTSIPMVPLPIQTIVFPRRNLFLKRPLPEYPPQRWLVFPPTFPPTHHRYPNSAAAAVALLPKTRTTTQANREVKIKAKVKVNALAFSAPPHPGYAVRLFCCLLGVLDNATWPHEEGDVRKFAGLVERCMGIRSGSGSGIRGKVKAGAGRGAVDDMGKSLEATISDVSDAALSPVPGESVPASLDDTRLASVHHSYLRALEWRYKDVRAECPAGSDWETERHWLPVSEYVLSLIDVLKSDTPDWEVLSYLLRHLPVHLSTKHFFCVPKTREGMIPLLITLCTVTLRGVRKHQDALVEVFLLGLNRSLETVKVCLNALSICAVELPELIMKNLAHILERLSRLMKTADMAVYILDFVSIVGSLPALYANFREEEFRPSLLLRPPEALRFHRAQLLLANEAQGAVDEPTEVCFDWLARDAYATADPRVSGAAVSLVSIRTVPKRGWIEVQSGRPSGETRFLRKLENFPQVGPSTRID